MNNNHGDWGERGRPVELERGDRISQGGCGEKSLMTVPRDSHTFQSSPCLTSGSRKGGRATPLGRGLIGPDTLQLGRYLGHKKFASTKNKLSPFMTCEPAMMG